MLAVRIVRSAGDRAHDAPGQPLGELIDARGRGGASFLTRWADGTARNASGDPLGGWNRVAIVDRS